MTRAQALADVDRLIKQWRTIVPAPGHVPSDPNHRIRLDPLLDDMVGGVRQSLVVLQAAVGFVLLIACANLANLLVARADVRMKEYALRSALGASRGRLFRQLLSEGLLLTIVAGIVGVGFAYAGLAALLSVNPTAIPRTAEVAIDWTVLAFTLGLAVVTGFIFALVPLLHLGGNRASEAFRESSTRTTAGGARAWMRSLLVVGEVALAVTLVVGAGLLIRSFQQLVGVDMGFNRSTMTTFGVVLPPQKYNTQQRIDFYKQLTEKLENIPGVNRVAAMSGLPPLRNVNANDTDFEHIPPGRPPGSQPVENVDFWQYVSMGYADTMGIPLVKGRQFEATDVNGQPVALINEAMVRKFFPDRDPIGLRLKPGFGDQVPWLTIVGVLKDVKQGGVAEAAGTELYMLTEQVPKFANFAPGAMNFVVRSPAPLDQLAPGFRRAVTELDAGAADHPHALDGQCRRRRDRAAALPDRVADDPRRARARARRRGHVRRALVPCESATPGDRHPHGARRGSVVDHGSRPRPRAPALDVGSRSRPRRVARPDAAARHDAVQCDAHGSAHVGRGRRRDDRHRCRRLPRPGVASDESGSARHAAAGVGLAAWAWGSRLGARWGWLCAAVRPDRLGRLGHRGGLAVGRISGYGRRRHFA